MVLVDSKRPFYFVSAILILSLLSIIFYLQYQKIIDKKSVTVITAAEPVKIRVEFAETREELANGLMNRKSLDKNSGMLFIFSDENTRSFWMKNTLIPLDIIFISSKGRVNEIVTLNPCQETEACQAYDSKTPAQYVLEINAGSAEKWGITPGDIVQLPNF